MWCTRSPWPDGDPDAVTVTGYASDRYPPGVVLDAVVPDAPELVPADRLLTVRYLPDRARVAEVVVSSTAAPGAPALWYVEQPEPDAVPPSMNLVAFDAPHFADGKVVDRHTFDVLGLSPREQVAAIRWQPDSGRICQIYIAPRRRRQRIATKLVYVAAGYRAAWGWAPLHSDGAHTELGHAWLAAAPAPWRHSIPARTQAAPPMTPPAEAEHRSRCLPAVVVAGHRSDSGCGAPV